MQGRAVNQHCQHNCVVHPVLSLLYKYAIMLLHPITVEKDTAMVTLNVLALQCLIPIKPVIDTRLLFCVLFLHQKNYGTRSKHGSAWNCYMSVVAWKIHVK